MKRKLKNLDFFSQSSAISPHLYCPICKEVFQDPRRLFCGHTFCAVCLRKSLKVCEKCPECRSPVAETLRNELPRDLITKKIVEDLGCYCVNAGICEWKGSFSKLSAHLKECPCEKLKKLRINSEFSQENTIVIEGTAENSQKNKKSQKNRVEVILIEEEEDDEEISLGNASIY